MTKRTSRGGNPAIGPYGTKKTGHMTVTGSFTATLFYYFFRFGNGGGTLPGPSSSGAAARIITVLASPA